MLKRITSILFLVGISLLTTTGFATSVMLDDSGEEYVWVEPYELPSGEVIEGFWRPVDQYGELWVEPFYVDDEFIDAGWVEVPVPEGNDDVVWEPSRVAADGDLREGYWRASEREGYAWTDDGWESDETVDEVYVYESGYVNERHVWVNGFYRKRLRVGYTWTEGYYLDGVYHYGYWSPVTVPVGYTYVPGHVGLGGYWVSGFYRPSVYVGYQWVGGYYVGSVWYWGTWAPLYHRHDHVYVHGHVHNGYWVNGHWRTSHRHGHSWRHGYYHGGVYHKGSWVKGRHPGKTRTTRTTVYYAKKSGLSAGGAKPSVRYANGAPERSVRAASVGGRGRPVGERARTGRNAALRYGDTTAMERVRSQKGDRKNVKMRGARDAGKRATGVRNGRSRKSPVAKKDGVRPKPSKSVRKDGNVRTRTNLSRSERRTSRAQDLRRHARGKLSSTNSSGIRKDANRKKGKRGKGMNSGRSGKNQIGSTSRSRTQSASQRGKGKQVRPKKSSLNSRKSSRGWKNGSGKTNRNRVKSSPRAGRKSFNATTSKKPRRTLGQSSRMKKAKKGVRGSKLQTSPRKRSVGQHRKMKRTTPSSTSFRSSSGKSRSSRSGFSNSSARRSGGRAMSRTPRSVSRPSLGRGSSSGNRSPRSSVRSSSRSRRR